MIELEERLLLHIGNITHMKVDAIVNAASSSLLGGGGVDGAIHSAGGGIILKECKELRKTRYPDGLPSGEAVITTAGKLKAKYIIHTVGPVWQGGDKGEDEILRNAYTNSLRTAVENDIETIAFPAISTGVYGFPKKRASMIAAETILNWISEQSSPKRIILVFFREADGDTFKDVYNTM